MEETTSTDPPGRAVIRGCTLAAVTVLLSLACSNRSSSTDPLHEMLVAQCERRRRCNCNATVISDDCEAYARTRAGELRDQGLRGGATVLDADCAALARDVADEVCADAGIPYEGQAMSDAARAHACHRSLFHGVNRVGEPCEHPVSYTTLQWSDCEAGLICREGDEGPRCVRPNWAGVGFICRFDDAALGCPVDLVCVDVEEQIGRCLPFTKVGDPCIGMHGDHCEGPPGQWCDLETSTCRASPPAGQPCIEHNGDPCATDAFCREGTCSPRPGPGEACEAYGACARGLKCSHGICEGGEACWL